MVRSTSAILLTLVATCMAQEEIPVLKQSIVVTSSAVEPAIDRRNSEVFDKTLFSRDDQIFHTLDDITNE